MPVNPTTKVGIINNALVRLGQSPISGLNDPKAEAIAASEIYDQVKRGALNYSNWAFAFAEFRPAELTAPKSDFSDRYNHAYPLPNDSLRILGVWAFGVRSGLEYIEAVEGEIWTNDTDPQFIYIRDVPENQFTPEFVDWIVLELAAAFALPVTQDMSRKAEFDRMALDAKVTAVGIDGQRDTPLRLHYEDLLNSGFQSRF